MASSQQTVGEEIFSSITHGLGAMVGFGVLVYFIGNFRKLLFVKGLSLVFFGLAFLLLFLFSTLFHSLSTTKAKRVFQILDHSAIYVFIAATYTPLLLLVVGGVLGWIIFGLIWLVTVLGVIYKSLFLGRLSKLSLILYLSLGWCAILLVQPLALGLSTLGLSLLILGGVFYTAGAVVYAKRFKFNHGIWHLLVMAGSFCHLLSLLTI